MPAGLERELDASLAAETETTDDSDSDGELIHDGGDCPHAVFTLPAFAAWHNAIVSALRNP